MPADVRVSAILTASRRLQRLAIDVRFFVESAIMMVVMLVVLVVHRTVTIEYGVVARQATTMQRLESGHV
jgi:hypothetical protein